MTTASQSSKVAFNSINVTVCICPVCPVQTSSKCCRDKMPGMREAIKANSMEHDKIPALYCASGKAGCDDLKFKLACICQSCPVFVNNSLKTAQPKEYFCRDGASR